LAGDSGVGLDAPGFVQLPLEEFVIGVDTRTLRNTMKVAETPDVDAVIVSVWADIDASLKYWIFRYTPLPDTMVGPTVSSVVHPLTVVAWEEESDLMKATTKSPIADPATGV